jgi:hypothetical protein
MNFFQRLMTAASTEWRAYTEHPFTNGLADGSLAEAAFRRYLMDWLEEVTLDTITSSSFVDSAQPGGSCKARCRNPLGRTSSFESVECRRTIFVRYFPLELTIE